MINWINSNGNFLLVLLTAIYVLANISVLAVMMKSNQISRKSIEQVEKIERERSRPYLSLELRISIQKKGDLPLAHLILKNTGITQAYNVSIEMNPVMFSTPLVNGKSTKKIPYFIEHAIEVIPPASELADGVGFLPNLFKNFETPIFRGNVEYADANNQKYSDSFVINLDIMRMATPYSSASME